MYLGVGVVAATSRRATREWRSYTTGVITPIQTSATNIVENPNICQRDYVIPGHDII